MSGLGELFDEAEVGAARTFGDARLAGSELDGVHGKVRRAHARRAAMRTGLAAVAVIVVGAGVVYGMNRLGGAPVAASPSSTASASPSVTPSASPTPSPSLTMPAFAGGVTVDPHLPDAEAITPEVWASVGPGWALVSYQEMWTDIPMYGPQVIYLVSPNGDRYQLTSLERNPHVSVLAWEAGSTSVPVSVGPDGDPGYAGMLDLVTGTVTQIDGYAPYRWSLAFLDTDGTPIYTGNDATAAYIRIAPDGTQTDYTVPAAEGALDLASQKLGLNCAQVAPYDDTSVLVSCGGDVERRAVARVSVADDSVDELSWGTAEDQQAIWPTRAGDSVVALLGADCFSSIGAYNGQYSIVPGSAGDVMANGNYFQILGATSDRVIWSVGSGCNGDAAPDVIVNSSLTSDDYSVLMPLPGDRPKGEDPFQSVTGVAVGQ